MELLAQPWKDVINELSRNIMRGIALALCGSPYEFEGERAGDPFWILRIVGYPGVFIANGHNKEENDIGWYCNIYTNYDTIVEPIDICERRSGGSAKYGRAVYGEYLSSKVKKNFS
ncbi:hypothetical protein Ddye_010580 [Dipteronia dyeriana]|uniref:Uncharacterized protein n=1 Tax=Dipteronia dyeriana TaxID=168575 RepID=A0AAD9XDT0_9ROSI|nr:hypothetical protein Ddye_010580 [Dipteronia dyeriana]